MITMLCKNTIKVFASLVMMAGMTACFNKKTESWTEKVTDTYWEVAVCEVGPDVTDLPQGHGGLYAVADTASINSILSSCGDLTHAWTIAQNDSCYLVFYNPTPILIEQVAVTDANYIPAYGDNIQVAWRFADSAEWARITSGHIGQRLAIFVNGQLMNAPQVNCEITGGACSVAIPVTMIRTFLPDTPIPDL